MNIYVISLKNSPRREIIKSRLASAGKSFEFIDAVPKESITEEVLKAIYDQEACLARHGRELVKAEIACFMSHLQTWNVIAESGKPAVILEDDAKLTSEFGLAYEILLNQRISSDVVLLGQSKLKTKDERKHYFHNPIFNRQYYGKISIGNVYKLWTSGAVGYYITPTSAIKLAINNKSIKCVVDDWQYHSENGLTIKEIRPYVISEDFECMGSYIEHDRNQVCTYRGKLMDNFLELARTFRAIYRNIASRLK